MASPQFMMRQVFALRHFWALGHKTRVAAAVMSLWLTSACRVANGNSIGDLVGANGDGAPVVGPSAPVQAGQVQVWASSADLAVHLERQADLALAQPSDQDAQLPRLRVEVAQKRQPIEGFGASLTDASAYLINRKLDQTQIDTLMTHLFSTQSGIGLSLLRQPMGASDFSHVGNYSYDDGEADVAMRRFSVAHDEEDILPLLRIARAKNENLRIMAAPWSAPAWMKTSKAFNGGSIDAAYLSAYADYFVAFIKAYAAQGAPIWSVSPQNEPDFESERYPTMRMDAAMESRFIAGALGPALAANQLDSKILAFEHNACEQGSDICPATHPQQLLEDASAAQYIHGIAWHCYNGDLHHVSEFHERYPQAAHYMTECSGGSWQDGSPSYLRAELWLLFASMNNWLRTAITWNVALDPAGGPSNNGSPNCRGVVTIAPDTGEVTYNAEFYALGHLSKFWRPGAFSVPVASDLQALNTAAYQNANGETVLLVENTRSSEIRFWTQAGALGFVAVVPAGAAITYIWREPS